VWARKAIDAAKECKNEETSLKIANDWIVANGVKLFC